MKKLIHYSYVESFNLISASVQAMPECQRAARGLFKTSVDIANVTCPECIKRVNAHGNFLRRELLSAKKGFILNDIDDLFRALEAQLMRKDYGRKDLPKFEREIKNKSLALISKFKKLEF